MLSQFQLHEKLGEGADSEAFAATDTRTGAPVVVKRPHPMLIVRRQHDAVERRIAKVIRLRERLGAELPHIAKMLAYTERASHDAYFGDALGAPYTVVVEERARGIPLVGSPTDGIKRHPIGLPQNLFAIHPVIAHERRGRFSIVRDILEVAQAFNAAGALILDLRPQNIYFDPAGANITVIDIGGVTEPRPSTGRRPPVDLHDLYFELFKWYIPHSPPHADADEYRHPIGMETIPMFNQNLDAMIRRHTEAADAPCDAAALDILHKVKTRAYTDIHAFRREFDALLTLLEARYADLCGHTPTARTWRDALHMLTDDYWRKFRFHPQDLSGYRSW